VDDAEIRLRCIEAAAKTPAVHPNGYAAGVQEAASIWFNWIKSNQKAGTLGLPGKK
jgi:hypothetical protein